MNRRSLIWYVDKGTIERKDRFHFEMEEYNKKKQNTGSHLPRNLENSEHTLICRQYGSRRNGIVVVEVQISV